MDPKTKIAGLPGVGSYYKLKLKRLGIETVEDLIYHFPFRYDDFSKIEKIRDVNPDEKITIEGIVWQIKNVRLRNGKFITNATVADESGTVEVVWFYQPYLTKTIKAGMPITLSGKAKREGNKVKMLSPQFEIPGSAINQPVTSNQRPATIHTGRLVAIYPETEGLSSKWIRAKIALILDPYLETQKDFLPYDLISRQKLLPINTALKQIHQPSNYDEVEKARKRLSFDELFILQLISVLRKKDWQEKRGSPKLAAREDQIAAFINKLPFKLTGAQKKAYKEILEDLKRSIPTNRLLEGDVGSGKTVVAAIAAFVTYLNNFDVLLAAPTEILAFQHQKTLETLLKPFGIKIGIWTGSKKNTGDVICGTHALLNTFKSKRPVGLVIVDEQHRFGVAQRAKLFLDQSKKNTPHLLTMTATPIPRTLALTLYGDLDLSVLDEMPKGRLKIATFIVPNFKRHDAYKFIAKQINLIRQAFIITPFVEPSETMTSVKAATVEFEKLKKIFSSSAILNTANTLSVNSVKQSHPTSSSRKRGSRFSIPSKNLRVNEPRMTNQKPIKLGLLHGRLKSKEKEEIINKFKANKINILVTTPVVEVGIDIPNATVMMIESSERFGLAQLHQLRGRVGRGEHKSYCLLFTDSNSQTSIKRLKSMERVHVGFELAQIDLKMRGQGEVFGLKQSGFDSLKIADLSDQTLIANAQKEARLILKNAPNLEKFPLLKNRLSQKQSELSQPN